MNKKTGHIIPAAGGPVTPSLWCQSLEEPYTPLSLSKLVLPLTHLLWQPKGGTHLRKQAHPPTQQLLTETAYLTKHWTKLQGGLQDEFCIYQL